MPDALDAFDEYWKRIAERKRQLIAQLTNQPMPEPTAPTITYEEVRNAARGKSDRPQEDAREDAFRILRDDRPVDLVHYNSDLIQSDRRYALTAAALISAMYPEELVTVRGQYAELVGRFRDGFEV